MNKTELRQFNEELNYILENDDSLKEKLKENFYKVYCGVVDEITINNFREDLIKYGGTGNISLIKGDDKGGINHIYLKHFEDIDDIVQTLINGKVDRVISDRKIFLTNENCTVILSLDYCNFKKTWILTGYKENKKA